LSIFYNIHLFASDDTNIIIAFISPIDILKRASNSNLE